VPVNTLGFGAERWRDIAVTKIQSPGATFRNMTVSISAEIRIDGFGRGILPVFLKKEGKIVQEKPLVYDERKNHYEVEFKIVADETGNFNYAVSVAKKSGEAVYSNNRQEFRLQVVRDKLRVIYICGQPGYDYAFRRLVLKNNPNIDLVSFVILRNPENIALVPDSGLSLIPFPAQEVFSRDLSKFDVFIIENFDFARFGVPRQHFANLVEWIRRGGGLLLIGGPRSFFGGGYASTALAGVLPVEMSADQQQMIPGEFRIKCRNYDSPVLRLVPEAAENIRIWENLPPLEFTQKIVARPGADVLLYHPSALVDGKPAVVMATTDLGRGRIAVFGSPTTFLWALGADSPLYYQTFWENVIRYLSHTEQSLLILRNTEQVTEGRTVDFIVKPLVPVSPAAVLEVYEQSAGDKTAWVKSAAVRRNNEYNYSRQFLNIGRYLIQFILKENGRVVARQETTVEVIPDSVQEEKALEVNAGLLSRLAAQSGGKFYLNLSDSSPDLAVKPVAARLVRRKPYIPESGLFGMIIALLLAEWAWRRFSGLW
jgi:uncharacterized membrane protein